MRYSLVYGDVMNVVFRHTYSTILDLIKAPAYTVSTIAFPCLFYVIFAVPESTSPQSSNMLLASFSCFAVFGVMFLQFGVGISNDRQNSWYDYIRTLPIPVYKLMLSRLLSIIFFSFISALAIAIISILFTSTDLSFAEWIEFFFLLHMAGLPFCFMGLCLGFWFSEKSALPVGNLIYLPLSFAGGLWKPPKILPESVQDISIILPTRFYVEILWAFTSRETVELKFVFLLILYSFIFLILSYLGFRKDYNNGVNL